MSKQLVPDHEYIEGEDSVSHEEIHADLMAGIEEMKADIRAKRLSKFVAESADWIGRAPSTEQERQQVTTLRKRALALTGN